MKKFFISAVAFAILAIPAISFAANTPLVVCTQNCNFNDFMALVNRVIRFVLFDLSIPIAAIMFAYAGILMVTGGEEAASTRTKAKNIFTNAALGLIIAAAGWLIIRTILSILGYNGAWIGF